MLEIVRCSRWSAITIPLSQAKVNQPTASIRQAPLISQGLVIFYFSILFDVLYKTRRHQGAHIKIVLWSFFSSSNLFLHGQFNVCHGLIEVWLFFLFLFSLIAPAHTGRLALCRPASPLSLTTLWPLACGGIAARKVSSLSLNQWISNIVRYVAHVSSLEYHLHACSEVETHKEKLSYCPLKQALTRAVAPFTMFVHILYMCVRKRVFVCVCVCAHH